MITIDGAQGEGGGQILRTMTNAEVIQRKSWGQFEKLADEGTLKHIEI